MKIGRFTLYLLAAVAMTACSGVCRQDGAGVTIKVQQPVAGGPELVRLQVMGDKLIRVSATPERKFADPQSLVIIPAAERTPFAVGQKGDTVTVKTAAVQANVLASTGEVWFTDLEGNVLLREEAGGGKLFEPVEVEGFGKLHQYSGCLFNLIDTTGSGTIFIFVHCLNGVNNDYLRLYAAKHFCHLRQICFRQKKQFITFY